MNVTELLRAYASCYRIRHCEEEIARRYPEGKMRTPTHLSIGQEAAAVGVCMALRPEDRIFSAHRCHAHYLAKGGSLPGLIAELHGKATGCAIGVGGSMHLVDESVHMMGTSAIVGSSISVAVGSAWAAKLSGADWCSVAFFGDAALETGQLYEAVNFAALHSLQILFVCENNSYATQTHISFRQPNRPFAVVAGCMGLQSFANVSDRRIDDVYETAKTLRAKLPAYLEVATYRYREHVGPNYDWDWGFRTKSEVEKFMANDPVKALRARLPAKDAERIECEVQNDVHNAFTAAEAAPWPMAVTA